MSAPAPPPRAVVIGYGFSGRSFHSYLIGLDSGIALHGVASRSDETRQRAAAERGCRTYPSFEAVLEDPDVDLVVLATPNNTHCGLVVRALDAGASTGGFTDVLLQSGAREVVAVDVGHGQLHERLRADPRVTNLERTNVRHITTAAIGGPVDLVVGDLSFISLRLVVDSLAAVCHPGSPMVLLVKPQFEAGKDEVSRGRGVITDPAVYDRVRGEVTEAFRAAGCTVAGWTESPITGAEGNREFLIHAVAPGSRP